MMFYRRVRRSEQNDLHDLCRSDERWTKYYPGHPKWINRVLSDISEDRVVIGAYKSFPVEGAKTALKLVGCLFLKKSEFQNTIELKNLILPADEDEFAVTSKLLEKAVNFCEIRNIDKIEIEIPQDEHTIISAFLRHNFRIASLRERFSPNVHVCIMERTIGDTFYGDPFDSLAFAKWFLAQYFPINILDIDQGENGILKIEYESRTISKAFSDANPVGKTKRLKGVMWYLEHSETETIDKDINFIIKNSANFTFRLLLVDFLSPSQAALLKKHHFICVTNEESKIIAGSENSSKRIPFNAQEIGGAITVLEQEVVNTLSSKLSTTYYLFSGIGKGLTLFSEFQNEEEVEFRPILAVYCPDWDGANPGVIGYFEIESSEEKSYQRLLLDGIPDDSLLEQDDIEFYQLYSEMEVVMVLHCGRFVHFKESLPISGGTWFSSQKVADFFYSEIVTHGNNSSYLDIKSAQKLSTLFSNLSAIPKSKEMILESIAAAISILADSISIGQFTKEQIDSWQNNLTEKNIEAEAKISTSPRLKELLDIQITELDALIKKYKELVQNASYTTAEKAEQGTVIAARALGVLKKLEKFKSEIDDYDDIVEYFKTLSNS